MAYKELEDIKNEDSKLPYSTHLESNLEFVRTRITELRLLEKNTSERSLGYDIGKGASYIQQITSGKILPTLIPLFQLCERFNVQPKEFFDPDFHNPALLNKAIRQLKKLRDEDISYLIVLMEKLER